MSWKTTLTIGREEAEERWINLKLQKKIDKLQEKVEQMDDRELEDDLDRLVDRQAIRDGQISFHNFLIKDEDDENTGD